MENTTSENHGKQFEVLSRAEILIRYHNEHMRQLLADYIMLATFNKVKDDEVARQYPVKVPGSDKVMMKKVMIKEERINLQRSIEQNTQIIETIEEILKSEAVELPDQAKVMSLTTNKA